MKRVAAVLSLAFMLIVVASCNRQQQKQQGSTVVLIVRHADKASEEEDSPLSDMGRQRAQALALVAQDAGVSAIYTTQFKRNHETAQPLAERIGVAVTELPVNLQNPGDYGKRLAADILDKHRGQTVLVIGHGNTVASIAEGLTGRTQQLGDIQYSDLLIVSVPPSGQEATLIRAQYGVNTTVGGTMPK